jgi:hypothetical protein
MRIQIAERLKPFTHVPGEYCLLPRTTCRCQIFPALIKIENLITIEPESLLEVQLNIKGPVKDFTVVQDLEKGSIQVWGHAQQGYFRYSLYPNLKSSFPAALLLHIEKAPSEGIYFHDILGRAGDVLAVSKNQMKKSEPDALPLPSENMSVLFPERLSLGNHKAQDWTLVHRRQDLGEIMPIWLKLGESIPYALRSLQRLEGTSALLETCQELIFQEDRLAVLQGFKNIFLAGFDGILSPRLLDTQHQGFSLPPLLNTSDLSPLVLLSEGARLIRSLFVQSCDREIAILPVLPVEFHCGRLLNVQCGDIAALDMEWSKKKIRRMILRAKTDGECKFTFKDVTSFRLKKHRHHPGSRISCGQLLSLEKNQVYFLDNFMH